MELKFWSYSSWAMYNQCPYRWSRRYIKGIREPDSPALVKGNKVHKLSEDYLTGKLKKLPAALIKLKNEYKNLRKFKPVVEQYWGVNRKFKPSKKKSWCLMKMDAAVKPCKKLGMWLATVDLKTGRQYPTHRRQAHLYATIAMVLHRKAKGVLVELWYSDTGAVVTLKYPRSELRHMVRYWLKQGRRIFAQKKYPKTPSEDACRFCPLRSDKGGKCKAWRSVL